MRIRDWSSDVCSSDLGRGLSAGNARVIDAQGKPLTPALFGGITGIGIEEVSGEDRTTDNALALGAGDKDMVVRPEFDVTLAYNPDSVLVPVTRVEGIVFTLLGAGSAPGGSLIVVQGAVVRLDGGPDPLGPRVLFVQLGSDRANLTGRRSEEHTSELQSLMRISYAVLCLTKT